MHFAEQNEGRACKMSLTILDLKKVYRTTFEAKTEWKNILLELEVSSATIKSIGTRCQDDPKECYREGLSEWLEGGERSWGDLVEALSSPTVGRSDIAMVIEREYIQSHSTASSNQADVAHRNSYLHINQSLTIFTNENLGSGAFGVVFKGSYENRPCAVKVLHQVAMQIQMNIPAGPGNARTIEAFDRECGFLESFQHPNIVQHLSTDKHPMSGSTILVTELMDCNLRTYLSGLGKEFLNNLWQLSLTKDVASGLAYIHSRQIIHRDLCGDNILLTLSQSLPVAKISDFGMSRLLDPYQMSHTLTAVGHRMGYLPPEALRLDSEDYDHSLDVFSLGVIMVQIVCKAETVKTAKDRSFLVSQIPPAHKFKLTISDCLQEDKEKRPTAINIRTLLERELKLEKLEMVHSGDHVTQKRVSSAPVRGGAARLADPPQELRLPLTVKWRRGKDVPIRMGDTVQSVVIGPSVYVGGGDGGSDHNDSTVMKLDLQRDEWTQLPQYSAIYFAMTSLDNQLVLVGGSVRDPLTLLRKLSNQIAVFESGEWTNRYPPMNTARRFPTAVSFNNYIIVAGGFQWPSSISSVEVLDVASKRWYNAESLPNSRHELKSTLIVNTLYLMGGKDHESYLAKVVHKVDLNKLITKALSKQATPTLWQTIEDVPHYYSTPLSVRGSLLAVGGRYDRTNPSSSIHLYQPDIRRWVKVGDLPTARYCCTCSVLPSGEVIVAGGQTGPYEFISTVDFLSITNAP